MWLFGGTKTRTRAVPGGRVGSRYCKATVVFRECTVADQVHVFFVSLLDHESRRMVCCACGEDHDIEEFARSQDASRPPSSREPTRMKNPVSRRQPTEAEIDDELAALKRRLGQ
jgi:hypothetical protein